MNQMIINQNNEILITFINRPSIQYIQIDHQTNLLKVVKTMDDIINLSHINFIDNNLITISSNYEKNRQ